MAVETMAGTAACCAAHGYDTEALRGRVATPGGPTEQRADTLERARPARRAAARPWTRWWRRRAMSLWLPRSRATTSADYVETLTLVYLVLIFIRILMSWFPRIPYNRYLNTFLKFVTRRDRPVPEPVPPLPAAGADRPGRARPQPDRGHASC